LSHRGIYKKGQFIVGGVHSPSLAAGCPYYGQPLKPQASTSLADIEQRMQEAARRLEELRQFLKRKK